MTDKWEEKVDRIIDVVSEREELSRSVARRMVHQYVCHGECGWYKIESKKVGFNRHNLTEKQKELMEETVKRFMEDLTIKEVQWRIHRILCPGHPRSSPERDSG